MRGWWMVVALCCGVWTVAVACPEGCSCTHDQGLYTANCSSLPYSGGKVQALTLRPSRDSPLELSDGQFNAARHLKYLDLKNCSIYFVHKKAFYGAKNVIEIDLSFNFIEELEPTVFQHLSSLTTLVLRGNPIQFVSEVPFLISNSLQHLDMGQCKIRTVPRGIFYGLKRLKYLSMDGNLLKSLKYNSLPKGLKYLNLSRNLIVNVPTEVLSSLTNLRRLGLSGNPINCSCSLMNLQDWLSGRGVILEDDVLCELPLEYNGVSWSKVNENKLCLDEARREEMSQSTVYSPLFKNKLYRGNYFENENSYMGENVQSDQPQPVLPESQAEVLFKNEETLAMGEMMRDEEDTKAFYEHQESKLNTDAAFETDKEPGLKNEPPTEEKRAEDESSDLQNDNANIDNLEDDDSKYKKEESVLPVESEKSQVSENVGSETVDSNLQDPKVSLEEGTQENKESVDNSDVALPDSDSKDGDKATNSSSETIEKGAVLQEENTGNTGDQNINSDPSQPVHFNESNPVEYKPLTEEDTNTELDDFKKEGLFHVDSEQLKLGLNDTEEVTDVPPIEDTTEDEVIPTESSGLNDDEIAAQNSSTTTESNNGTIIEDPDKTEEDGGVMETVPPPVVIHDLSNNVTQRTTDETPKNDTEPFLGPQTHPEDKKLTEEAAISKTYNIEDKIKEVAGAEVVMFCVAVLIICLILYSIYKCRTSSKRQNVRNVKDMESNRGTEMQDMASLLPKPEDDKKNNLKYPDKAPSSEIVKLITEKNEKEHETPNHSPLGDTKAKLEDKNSLNNNSTSSPTSKTPLIKPGNTVTINPAQPIQRTKVKVGIIPDSIPRTPIFLQKTYNNGTKHV